MVSTEVQREPEEILLSDPGSAFFPTDTADFDQASVKFTQANRTTLESKKFCIYDNKFLNISSYRDNVRQQYWVDLSIVHPKPQKKFIINHLWTGLVGIFIFLAAIVYFTSILELIPSIYKYKNTIIVLSATLGFLSLMTLFSKARSVVYFRSSNGAAVMIELLHNNPDKKTYNQFLRHISETAQQAKSNSDLGISQQLAAELKEHRRLRDQGILTPEAYETAKEQIFSRHSGDEFNEKILPH